MKTEIIVNLQEIIKTIKHQILEKEKELDDMEDAETQGQ